MGTKKSAVNLKVRGESFHFETSGAIATAKRCIIMLRKDDDESDDDNDDAGTLSILIFI